MESILEKRYAIMCQRHMSPEDWEAKNPILRSGEMGVEDGTQKFKFGDGVTPWNSLKYSAGGVTVMCLADEWPADYILQEGQIGVEEDTGLCKYGDGETVWDELPYAKAYAYGLNIGNSDSAGGVQ